MTRDMVQPRKSGTFFQIRRISSKKSCYWVKTFSRIFASQVVTRCKQPCLVWQGGSEESCKCGGSAVCQGSQIFPICCFQKHFQFWHFQVAKTGVWSHRFEYSEKLLSWPKLENLGRLHETPEKIISLAQPWKSKSLVFLMYHPPASLLTVLRFCMTNVSLNISQLHLWPFDAKSDL